MSQGGASTLRLMSDLKTVKQQPPEGVSASPLSEENIYVWGATVFGPDDTSWEGGIYTMRLMFTEQYPDKPPRVRFTTEMVSRVVAGGALDAAGRRQGGSCARSLRKAQGVSLYAHRCTRCLPASQFHPNIYPDGTLCLDLIQDNWSPIYSVSLHVTSVGALPAAHARSVLGRSRLLKPAPSRLPSRHLAPDAARAARTHAPPSSPPRILAPAARLTRHDSVPPGKLDPDCDPLAPDRPELRQPGQPGGCASLPDRHEAVLAESSAYSREVGERLRRRGPVLSQQER